MTKMVLGRVAAMISACVLGGNVSGTGTSALVLNETVQTETVASPVAMSDAKSEYVAQTAAALNQTASVSFAAVTVSVASEKSSDTTMVRVCQCKEHFVMEGDWKTEWRKHVIQVHGGSCHWGDNAFTEEEMRKYWPEDFEDKTAEDTFDKDQAAKEEAERKAEEERKAREEAERKAEEERKAKEEAERKAEEERKVKEEAERKAKEEAERKAEEERKAKEEAERKAEEERKAKEEAERKAEEERKAREEAEREARIEAEEAAQFEKEGGMCEEFSWSHVYGK